MIAGVVAAVPVEADVAVSAADVVALPVVDVAASAVVAVVLLVADEVASVVDEVLLVDVVAGSAVDVVVDEVLLAAVALPVAEAVAVEESPVLVVVPTSLSSLTVTLVSSSPRARRCSSSPRTSPLESLSTARSAFLSRHPLVLTAPLPRPNTVSGTLSVRSLLPVFSAVSTTFTLHQARRFSTSALPAVPRFRTLPIW